MSFSVLMYASVCMNMHVFSFKFHEVERHILNVFGQTVPLDVCHVRVNCEKKLHHNSQAKRENFTMCEN